jgi:hypothetical protein
MNNARASCSATAGGAPGSRQTCSINGTDPAGPASRNDLALSMRGDDDRSIDTNGAMTTSSEDIARLEDWLSADRPGRRVMPSKLYRCSVCALNHFLTLAPDHWTKRTEADTLVNHFTSSNVPVKRIAESTVRRLSAYLRFLEESAESGVETISSDALARRGGTTSAQVRKDLSFFGSFGKRGLAIRSKN